MGQISHASTLPDAAVGEAHAEELDAAVGARAGVVAIVAAMRAPPRHGGVGSDQGSGFGSEDPDYMNDFGGCVFGCVEVLKRLLVVFVGGVGFGAETEDKEQVEMKRI